MAEIPHEQQDTRAEKAGHSTLNKDSEYEYTGFVLLPKWFRSGKKQRRTSESAPGCYEKIRKAFELIYFISAGPCLLFIAAIAGIIGYRTLRAAESQLSEIQRENALDNRPWLVAFEIHAFPGYKDKQSVFFQVIIKNVGKTVTAKGDSYVSAVLGDSASALNMLTNEDIFPSNKNTAILAPDQMSMLNTSELSRENLNNIKGGEPIFIFGAVRYWDIFGGLHLTRFCFRPDPDLGTFNTPSIHNELLEYDERIGKFTEVIPAWRNVAPNRSHASENPAENPN